MENLEVLVNKLREYKTVTFKKVDYIRVGSYTKKLSRWIQILHQDT